MRKAFNKVVARSITRSMGRFLAIAIISLLGAGFYAGLRMAAPDMRIAGDDFFDASEMYDISMIDTLGIDDEGLDALRDVEGVGVVMGAYRADAMVHVGQGSYAASIESLAGATAPLNRPVLEQGTWPSHAGECVMGTDAAEKLAVSIGDAVTLEKAEGELADIFAQTELVVCGFVNSPLYISSGQMGSTSLGTGSIEAYLYVPEDAFAEDLPYTIAYLSVPEAREEIWDTQAYDQAVAPVKERVAQAADAISVRRWEKIVGDAQRELDDARADYEAERADAEADLADAASELASARTRLDNAAADLVTGRAQVDEAAAKIADSEKQLNSAEEEYAKGKADLDSQRAKFKKKSAKLDELKSQRKQLKAGIERSGEGLDVLKARRKEAVAAGDEALIAGVDAQIEAVNEQLAQLKSQLSELESGIAAIEKGASQLEEAQAKLDKSRAEIDSGWAELEKGRKKYLDGLQAYQDGLSEYLSGEQTYADSMAEYEQGKAEAEEGFADAEAELAEAQGEIDDIERGHAYVLDRTKNPGAASLSSDADGIAQIATFLPFMFFLVAALVSLTSMTRMVDEERLEIGTHKALGYGRARITSKYLVYGALASGIGAAAGVVALGKLLPWFILTSYQVSYTFPTTPLPLDPRVTAWALGLSLGVTLLATWGAAAASLREKPAALMLPRVPKAGKRIVLERIRPLWRHMSFSQKVTARNLLRYKRRFFMAVVGIAGCTALLMVGFGLRDAIGGIVANQYETLVSYDMAVRADEGELGEEGRAALDDLLASDEVEAHLPVDDFTMIAEGPGDDMRIEVVVPSDPSQLAEFVTLRERVGKNPLAVEGNSIVLTEKAANELGARVGDEVTLFDEDDVGDKTGDGRSFTLGGIAENYLGHFAFVAPDAYEAAFGHAPTYDLDYVKLADGGADGRSGGAADLADALLAIDGVNTVSFVADQIATYEEMLAVMDKLIIVIVLLSAALAFVVLYNLTNINITERVREIATLKVLGFTRREVNVYIFREVFVMALIGALAGCAGGVPLTFYIAEAAETANMMFGRTIEPASFALSFVITMVFSVIVAFAMRPKLSHVNMVESLKSVE